jgi:hypothetical protein
MRKGGAFVYPTQQPERRDEQNAEAWPTPNPVADNVFQTPDPRDQRAVEFTDDTYAPPVTGLDASRQFDPWNFRADSGLPSAQDIIGYHVEATDGRCGKVEEVHGAANSSFLVVDTGPWIFGHKAMLPAGVVTHVDHVDRNVYVDRTKDEIKNSPEVEAGMYTDATHREKVESYYATYYGFPPGGTAR